MRTRTFIKTCVFLIAGATLFSGQRTCCAQVPAVQSQGLAPAVELQDSGQVLGIPSTDCMHVIEQLHMNRFLQNAGLRGVEGGPGIMVPGLSLPIQPGDIELQGVQMISEGDGVTGPAYVLTLQNHSEIPVGDFRITLVAVQGRIHPSSPSVTALVKRMEVGAVAQFQVQLPASGMQMSNGMGQLAPFDTLVVAVDSFDQLMERDELNNVRILVRTAIPAVVAAVPAAQPAVTVEGGATQQPVQTNPAEATPTTPESNPTEQSPSPLDQIDVDKL
jgi:hypothetical protein